MPPPNGLNVREAKRIEATLAWLSPVNWRYRQYRCAASSFVCPAGAIPSIGAPAGHPAAVTTRGAVGNADVGLAAVVGDLRQFRVTGALWLRRAYGYANPRSTPDVSSILECRLGGWLDPGD